MEDLKVISGADQDQIWKQIEDDFSQSSELFEYNALIEANGKRIALNIDIDLGGGFEGGYAFTSFTSELRVVDDFRFTLHHQGVTDEIGKFFGMQDIELGYTEFDENVMVKTSHPERLKELLSDPQTRTVLQEIPEFNFHIGHHSSENTEVESSFLELRIEDGITDPHELRKIYTAFINVLEKLNA